MSHPVIGWVQEAPAPNHIFSDYLSARDGRLYYEDLDLAQLFIGGREDQGLGQTMPGTVEIIYLPKIRQKIDHMRRLFASVMEEIGYDGRFLYAYASKANAAEEVVRTVLGTGAHYEMSSAVDVEIARIMAAAGRLPRDRMVICNGFKSAGSQYADRIVEFKRMHSDIIPVIDDWSELPPVLESGLAFDVGLRQKSYGPHQGLDGMDAINSRFGMDRDDLFRAADVIAAAPNVDFKLYHAMVGSQILSADDFMAWLEPPIEIYAQLRQRHPSLSIFDFGGGMPVPMTLDFKFDYRGFVHRLLTTLQQVCDAHRVPVPDVMGEFGRYTTSEHGAHLFKVLAVKENGSKLPWYIINGSIMSSFPDSWALGEHFTVLPLNHLDKPFRQVQLGGITCDSDDVYPPKPSKSPLYLPVETEDLYVGFFSVGAYQEMLGGVRGSKHCVLAEAPELIVDRDGDGSYQFFVLPRQTAADVLRNLGYTTDCTQGQD
jgi:arginine decarboxylase